MYRAEMRTDELLSKLRRAECRQAEFERSYLYERRCAKGYHARRFGLALRGAGRNNVEK